MHSIKNTKDSSGSQNKLQLQMLFPLDHHTGRGISILARESDCSPGILFSRPLAPKGEPLYLFWTVLLLELDRAASGCPSWIVGSRLLLKLPTVLPWRLFMVRKLGTCISFGSRHIQYNFQVLTIFGEDRTGQVETSIHGITANYQLGCFNPALITAPNTKTPYWYVLQLHLPVFDQVHRVSLQELVPNCLLSFCPPIKSIIMHAICLALSFLGHCLLPDSSFGLYSTSNQSRGYRRPHFSMRELVYRKRQNNPELPAIADTCTLEVYRNGRDNHTRASPKGFGDSLDYCSWLSDTLENNLECIQRWGFDQVLGTPSPWEW